MDATEQENCESELYLAQANQTSRFNTQQDAREGRFNRFTSVSYTHLTLPTIYSV